MPEEPLRFQNPGAPKTLKLLNRNHGFHKLQKTGDLLVTGDIEYYRRAQASLNHMRFPNLCSSLLGVQNTALSSENSAAGSNKCRRISTRILLFKSTTTIMVYISVCVRGISTKSLGFSHTVETLAYSAPALEMTARNTHC